MLFRSVSQSRYGQIIWLDHQADGSIQTYHHDPETTQFQRFMMKTVSLFPIEWMM